MEIAGRRVVVADADGRRNCFLSGHRAVVGDRVRWVAAAGEGGKITAVDGRLSTLRRVDSRGEEQVLAANLEGVLVVVAAQDPIFAAPILDRYLTAVSADGMRAAIVLNKCDQPGSEVVETELAAREGLGYSVMRASAHTGQGIEALRAWIAAADGPWALVGASGVGKTSLVSALLPGLDVGPVGEISEYWGQGMHTTTRTRLFELPTGGELADSPGIRSFIPAVLDPIGIRDHYPGMADLGCKYRDCLHLPGEEGCAAEGFVPAERIASYRALLCEAQGITRRMER